jgi:hypothetical protein
MVLGLLLAMGRHSFPFRVFFEFVPGFDRFRVPLRLMVFWSAGQALLAALAVHALLSAPAPPRRRLLVVGLAGLMVGLALVFVSDAMRLPLWRAMDNPLLGNADACDRAERHLLGMTLRIAAGLLLAAGALAAGRLSRPTGRTGWWPVALALLAAAELIALAWPFQLSVPWSRLNDRFYPRTPVIQALEREHRGGAVLWMDDTLSYLTDQNQPEVLTNRLIMHGLPQARGYDPVNARWIGEWFNRLAGLPPDANPGGFMFVPRIRLPAWLALMGVESILAYQPLDAIPGLRPVERFAFPPDPQVPDAPATTLTLWRNERFRGRAFAAPLAPLADDGRSAMRASARRAGDPAVDPLAALFYDAVGFAADPEAFRQTLTRWPRAIDDRFGVEPLPGDPNRFRYRVSYPRPALLCLAQSAYEGWTAAIDGRPAPLLSDYCGAFVVVAVPEGRHEVTFRFVPPGLGAGRAVSLAALAAMLYGLLRSRRRRTLVGGAKP